jgi:uncharacterized membrane protein HdeD (DUF308 family)
MSDPRRNQGQQGASSSTSSGPAPATGAQVPAQAGRLPSEYVEYGPPSGAPSAGPGMSLLGRATSATAGALLFGAVCLIAVGIMLLVWPKASLTVVAILIGAAVVATGLVKLWEGFTASSQSGGMRAGYVVIGLLAVLAGVYLLRHHTLSIYLVAFVTGVYFIAHGVTDLGVAAAARVPGRGWRAVLGIFSLAAGLILVIWPGPSLVVLYTLVAAWLLFYGCVLAGLAFGVRRAAKSATAAPDAMSATA